MARVLGIVLAGGEGKRLMPLTRGPGQAGRAVRRLLPADRLRAVQPGQRGLPADRGADAVQVALARPAHLADLAAVDAARQLRRPGAGAAAPRPAVVPRQRRRDLPVDEPDQRRAARHHRGVRRRPRLPDGRLADGRGAHRVRRRRDGRRHPGAAQGGLAVRRDQDRRRRRRRSRSSSRSRPTRPGWSTPPTSRSPRWATTSSPPTSSSRRSSGTPPTRPRATTWAATSSRCWSSEGRRRGLRLQAQRGARAPPTRDRDYWRDVGTLDSYHEAHLDLVSALPVFNLYNTDWPIFTSHPQLPGAKFVAGAVGPRLHRLRRLDRLRRLGRQLA